jgi:hypothetical protein
LQAFGILTKGLENLLEGSNGQAHHCRDSGEDRIYQIDKEQILWYYYGMWMFRTRQLKQALALAPSWRRAVFVKNSGRFAVIADAEPVATQDFRREQDLPRCKFAA